MHVIATMSTLDVGRSLGLQPVTVRRMIRDGRLTAVRIGKSWRVHVDSVNALLCGSGDAPASAMSPTAASEATPTPAQPQSAAVSRAQDHHTTSPGADAVAGAVGPRQAYPALPGTTVAAEVEARPPAPKPRFSDEDMVWIQRYRRELDHADRDVAANARWQLEQFEKRAERDARWGQFAPTSEHRPDPPVADHQGVALF